MFRANSLAPFDTLWASLVAQRWKHLPAMRETWVWSLGGEDPLEKEMATHSTILAGESLGWRSLVGYSPQGCRVRHDWVTSLLLFDTLLMSNYLPISFLRHLGIQSQEKRGDDCSGFFMLYRGIMGLWVPFACSLSGCIYGGRWESVEW